MTPGPAAGQHDRRRRLRRAFLAISTGLLVTAAANVPLPYYVEQPGSALSLSGVRGDGSASVVQVAAPGAGPVEGDFLLTAVSFRRATPATWALAHVDDAQDLVPVPDVVPAGQRAESYFDAQREVFATTAEIASGVALEAAGYDVGFTGDGVLVTDVAPGSPAEGVLQPQDVVIAIDGEPVDTTQELQAALRDEATPPGPRLLAIQRGDGEQEVEVRPRRITARASSPQIGVSIRTVNERILLPVDVAVDAGRVGGPSAGLMIALTVYDMVEPLDLAAGRLVAGTGVIRADGTVGEIGGIRYKVIAAHRFGAQLFLAPATQAAEAEAALPPGSTLQVVGVSDLADALEVLGAGTLTMA